MGTESVNGIRFAAVEVLLAVVATVRTFYFWFTVEKLQVGVRRLRGPSVVAV